MKKILISIILGFIVAGSHTYSQAAGNHSHIHGSTHAQQDIKQHIN